MGAKHAAAVPNVKRRVAWPDANRAAAVLRLRQCEAWSALHRRTCGPGTERTAAVLDGGRRATAHVTLAVIRGSGAERAAAVLRVRRCEEWICVTSAAPRGLGANAPQPSLPWAGARRAPGHQGGNPQAGC